MAASVAASTRKPLRRRKAPPAPVEETNEGRCLACSSRAGPQMLNGQLGPLRPARD